MKKQISGNEYDLRTPYYTFIFILIGPIVLISILVDDNHLTDVTLIFIFLVVLAICSVLFFLIGKYVPYCYKIEVDESTIYVTRTEYIITKPIEKTIEIDKHLLRNVEDSLLGVKVFLTKQSVFYLHFNVETEYGTKIAYLGESRYIFNWDNAGDDELRKIL